MYAPAIASKTFIFNCKIEKAAVQLKWRLNMQNTVIVRLSGGGAT